MSPSLYKTNELMKEYGSAGGRSAELVGTAHRGTREYPSLARSQLFELLLIAVTELLVLEEAPDDFLMADSRNSLHSVPFGCDR